MVQDNIGIYNSQHLTYAQKHKSENHLDTDKMGSQANLQSHCDSIYSVPVHQVLRYSLSKLAMASIVQMSRPLSGAPR